MANKKQTKRKKSGTIKAWECHLRCEFTKSNDTNKYIESCAVKVDKPNLAAVKGTEEVYVAVDGWINELIVSVPRTPSRILF